MPVMKPPHKATLFHMQFWSSSRPAGILLELYGPSNDASPVDIVTITHDDLKNDPFLTKMNPQRRLPFFYDPKENDLCLNESGGLCQYLLEKYDIDLTLFPHQLDDPTRSEFLKLIHFGPATSYHIAVPILFHDMPPEGSEPTPIKVLEEKKKEWNTIVVPTLEYALEKFGGPYLLGSKFSAVDIVCGYDIMTVGFSKSSSELIDVHPKIKAYYDLISKRPVYQQLFSVPTQE